MAFKFLALLGLASLATAIELQGYHQPQPVYAHPGHPGAYVKSVQPIVKAVHASPVYKQVEYEAPAEYDFSYSVQDDSTGDVKSQEESRKGDSVHGSYSLIDADGFKRTVEYTADEENGFNAVVHREPLAGHHQPIAKVATALPVAKYVAPVAKVLSPAVNYVQQAPVYHHQPAPVYHHQPAPVYHHQPAPVYHHQPAPIYHHQPAPVYHHQPAPIYHHQPAPVYQPIVKQYAAPAITKVTKYVAPVVTKTLQPIQYASAPQLAHYSHGHDSGHVSYNAPSSNYHY